MSVYVFQRVSQDKLIALAKALQEGAWGAIDAKSYEDAPQHTAVPVLSLLKLRLLQGSNNLAAITSGASDLLQAHDARWDAAQKRYVLKIATAEADDAPGLQAAGARLRKSTTLGDGLAQTKLAYDEEVAFGEKQVVLAQTTKRTNDAVPSPAEDIDSIGARSNIKEIGERTAEFKKALSQTTSGSAPTSRSARLRIATAECIAELNDAHRELDKQINAARSAETKANLKKLQDELSAAIPQEETSHPHPSTNPEPPKAP